MQEKLNDRTQLQRKRKKKKLYHHSDNVLLLKPTWYMRACVEEKRH